LKHAHVRDNLIGQRSLFCRERPRKRSSHVNYYCRNPRKI